MDTFSQKLNILTQAKLKVPTYLSLILINCFK